MAQYIPQFEWDDNKDKTNQSKHGVSFDRATTVFLDPFCIIIEDNYTISNETRYLAIGRVNDGLTVLMVVHTYRDKNDEEIIRIISARKLSKSERKNYGYC